MNGRKIINQNALHPFGVATMVEVCNLDPMHLKHINKQMKNKRYKLNERTQNHKLKWILKLTNMTSVMHRGHRPRRSG